MRPFGGRDALLRVLADRQVRPTVFSSSLFRHARSLRGKFISVDSAFTSFRAASSEQFFLSCLRVHGGKAPAAVAPKRRSGAPRRRKAGAVHDASRGSEAIVENAPASWTVHPPQYCYGGRAVALHRFRFKARHDRTNCRWHGKIPGRR